MMYIHSNNETVERINVSEIANTSALGDYSTAAVIMGKYKGLSLREIGSPWSSFNCIQFNYDDTLSVCSGSHQARNIWHFQTPAHDQEEVGIQSAEEALAGQDARILWISVQWRWPEAYFWKEGQSGEDLKKLGGVEMAESLAAVVEDLRSLILDTK